MNKFIVKIIIFSLPLILFYTFPICVIFFGKEYYTAKNVVAIQNNNKSALYGDTYNPSASFIPYKKLLFETDDPDVFILGSSRSLQIKKDFFNSQTKFINAGMAGKTLNDSEYFVGSISTSTKNRVLLLVLDRELFLLDPSLSNPHSDSYISLFGFHFNLPLWNARGIYLDYFLRHKYSFIDLIRNAGNTDTIGITAFADGNGFRSDGSYRNYMESQDKNLASRNISQADTLAKDMSETKDNFPSSDYKNIAANMETLKEILSICKSKNIAVIGFIPPYITAINKVTLDKNSLNGEMYIGMTNNISSIFKENSFDFYDLSDISKYGGSDNEFLDTVHGNDLLYAKLSLYLAEHDKTMSNYFDIKALKNMIQNSINNFLAP